MAPVYVRCVQEASHRREGGPDAAPSSPIVPPRRAICFNGPSGVVRGRVRQTHLMPRSWLSEVAVYGSERQEVL